MCLHVTGLWGRRKGLRRLQGPHAEQVPRAKAETQYFVGTRVIPVMGIGGTEIVGLQGWEIEVIAAVDETKGIEEAPSMM